MVSHWPGRATSTASRRMRGSRSQGPTAAAGRGGVLRRKPPHGLPLDHREGPVHQYIIPRMPDMMFALKEAARQLQQPQWFDWFRLSRLARYRYFRDMATHALHMKRSRDVSAMVAYSDSDWAACTETRRTTSCCLLFWGDVLVHAHSRTQVQIGLSSSEAEFCGCCSTAAALLYVRGLLSFLGFGAKGRMLMGASSAIALATRCGVGAVRHLVARYLCCRPRWRKDRSRSRRWRALVTRRIRPRGTLTRIRWSSAGTCWHALFQDIGGREPGRGVERCWPDVWANSGELDQCGRDTEKNGSIFKQYIVVALVMCRTNMFTV